MKTLYLVAFLPLILGSRQDPPSNVNPSFPSQRQPSSLRSSHQKHLSLQIPREAMPSTSPRRQANIALLAAHFEPSAPPLNPPMTHKPVFNRVERKKLELEIPMSVSGVGPMAPARSASSLVVKNQVALLSTNAPNTIDATSQRRVSIAPSQPSQKRTYVKNIVSPNTATESNTLIEEVKPRLPSLQVEQFPLSSQVPQGPMASETKRRHKVKKSSAMQHPAPFIPSGPVEVAIEPSPQKVAPLVKTSLRESQSVPSKIVSAAKLAEPQGRVPLGMNHADSEIKLSEGSESQEHRLGLQPNPKDFMMDVNLEHLAFLDPTFKTSTTDVQPKKAKKSLWNWLKRKEKSDRSTSIASLEDKLKLLKSKLVVAHSIPTSDAEKVFGHPIPVQFLPILSQQYIGRYGYAGSPVLQSLFHTKSDPFFIAHKVDSAPSNALHDSYDTYEELRHVYLHDRIKYRLQIYVSEWSNQRLHPHCHQALASRVRFFCHNPEFPLVYNLGTLSTLEKVLSEEYPNTPVSISSLDKSFSIQSSSSQYTLIDDALATTEYYVVNVGDGCAFRANGNGHMRAGDPDKVCWSIVVKNAIKLGV